MLRSQLSAAVAAAALLVFDATYVERYGGSAGPLRYQRLAEVDM